MKKSFLQRYPLNLRIAEHIGTIQQELEEVAFKKEEFPPEDIFKIFLDRLERGVMAFVGSPLKGLQILGLLETRSLNFENVIVMDVNEGVLPQLRVFEPLIPREVMISLNLDRLEQEEEIQRYQLMRLIQGAKNVHLIYAEGKDTEKSRFVEELIWQRQQQTHDLNDTAVIKSGFQVKVSPKFTEVQKTPEVIAFLKGFRYSATSVNTYTRCPLRFYYQYVLGLEEKEDLLEEPENRQVGVFIHGLLEETFRQFVGQKPIIDNNFKKYFRKVFETRFEESFARSMRSDAFLLKTVLEVRLERLLAKEELANPLEGRDVAELLCLERRYEDQLDFQGDVFNFVYQVDRIDRLSDGTILIVDYKTGSEDPMPRKFVDLTKRDLSRTLAKNEIRSFQMPLYYHFLRKFYPNQAMNAAFYNLRSLDLIYFIDKKEGDSENFMPSHLKFLEFVLQEISDPKVKFRPDDSDSRYCAGCPFFNVCR